MQAFDLVGHVSRSSLVGKPVKIRADRDAHAVALRLFSQFVSVGVVVAAMDSLNRINAKCM